MNDTAQTIEAPGERYREIREEVAKLCAGFPGEYWRKLDETRGYLAEHVLG